MVPSQPARPEDVLLPVLLQPMEKGVSVRQGSISTRGSSPCSHRANITTQLYCTRPSEQASLRRACRFGTELLTLSHSKLCEFRRRIWPPQTLGRPRH